MSFESTKKRLVLLDAHAILHRAYHALPEFSNSKGEPTGALYGLASMLIKIISDLKPDYLAAAYDLPKPTFRHEAYKDYKAGRAKADDILISQMKRSREIFTAFGIPIYDKEGFEADDILGTIVHQLLTTNYQLQTDIVIASGDMDTLQLVDDKKVQVYTLKKGINDTILYDEEKVKERYGFGPELLPDYKGFRGDPSDNIKGVAGIGEKTATELIKNFGTIEDIYKELKTKNSKLKTIFKPRVIELLEKGKEDAEFSKILATIRRDAPIEFSLPLKEWRAGVDTSRTEQLFRELEFRTLGERLKEMVEKTKGLASESEKGQTLGETDTPLNSPLKKGGRGAKKEEERKEKSVPASLYPSKVKRTEEAEEEKGADGTTATEEKASTFFQETAVALWLINSNTTNPTEDDILNFAQTRDIAEARERIFAELKTRHLTRVFEEIEKPLIPVVAAMNERGVKIDTAHLNALSAEYHAELSSLEKNIHALAGQVFNINSPKQLGDIIFNKLQLKSSRQKKTAGGALSTRESELEKMRALHPIIPKILEYREFQKLLSTYIDPIPAAVGTDARLHARFLLAGTTTGRMASENPNLQNIPIQTERGRRIRNAFVAEKGFALLSFDYSQIELRIAAILSGDKKLIEIFKNGEDVHTTVAAAVFNVSRTRVTKEMRRQAKVINFGILYGMGVNSLRQALSEDGGTVSREDAEHFYSEYFADFYELAAYLETVKNAAHANGYTETLFGRRRYHDALRSPIPYIRAAAERAAVNAPIQGTGADIIKLAMVKVDEFLRREKLLGEAFLILQVHDELVYEVKKEAAERIAPTIKKIMESILSEKESRGVPIVVDVSVGDNWGSMQSIAQNNAD